MLLEGGQRWLPPAMTLPTGGSHQTAAQRGGELKVLHDGVRPHAHPPPPLLCVVSWLPKGRQWLHVIGSCNPPSSADRHLRQGARLCRGRRRPLSVTRQDKDTPLSDLQRDKFEDLLRGLTAERGAVRDAMTFALDHADCAAEVVDILAEALTLDETPIPTKVGSTLCVPVLPAVPLLCRPGRELPQGTS